MKIFPVHARSQMPKREPTEVDDGKMALCFVVGPIGKDGSPERKHSDMLLNAVIKGVLEQADFGYVVKRADEDADPGMINDRVIGDIIHAELVVADLTDLNPNALYELGIRHSTLKPSIHVARAGTILPFDTIAHRTIFVDLNDWHSIEQARERLAKSAQAIKAPGYKVSNPITQANASFKMRQSEDPRDQVMAEMQERMSVLENMIARARTVIEHEPSKTAGLDVEQDVVRQSFSSGGTTSGVGAEQSLKGLGVEQGVPRQSFRHGRTKAIVVEKVKSRTPTRRDV
jgi:hypothetical protein